MTSSATRALPGRKEPGQGVVASHGPCRGVNHHEGSGLGGVHASSPMLAAARESTAISSGSDSAASGAAQPNLHPQRTIPHPPMLRSISNPLISALN